MDTKQKKKYFPIKTEMNHFTLLCFIFLSELTEIIVQALYLLLNSAIFVPTNNIVYRNELFFPC